MRTTNGENGSGYDRVGAIAMDCVDIGRVYRWLGNSLAAFGPRLGLARPDACQAFFEEWRAQRSRADAMAAWIEEEVISANQGISNDGPDKWTADLDRLGKEKKGKQWQTK